MKRANIKLLSLVLALSIIFNMYTTVHASDVSELKGHWAEKTLTEWIELGLLKGDSNGRYNPDSKITRAEFMALVNRVMNYTEKSDSISNFSDVSPNKWYYDDVSKALAAGYINGTSATTLSPEDTITREQTITIISRIQGISPDGDIGILAIANDSAEISAWARGPVAGAIREGLVTGSNGNINPGAKATRCEAIVLLDRVRTNTRMYNFAGTYGPETGTAAAGNVIIAASGIRLQNTLINGDLEIAQTAAGEVTLNSVVVRGNLVVNGVSNPLYLSNVTVDGSIIVGNRNTGTPRIIVSGNSNVALAQLESGATLVIRELSGNGIQEVVIAEGFSGNNPVELVGRFNTVTNRKPNTEIILTGSDIGILNLAAAAVVEADESSTIGTAKVSRDAGGSTSMNIRPKTIAGDGAQYAKIVAAGTPTQKPTAAPGSSSPSAPVSTPTKKPTQTPTKAPTSAPTKEPTQTPTKAPTPTQGPTTAPTPTPTQDPTAPTPTPHIGTTYYIDYANGDDANDGTSKSSPWKHAPGMHGATENVSAYEKSHSNSQGTKPAGDSFIFKGGVTWPNDCFVWAWIFGGGTGWTVGTDAVYFGVDQTWYTGESWTRPIFDAEGAPVTTFTNSQPVVKNVMFRVYKGTGGYFIIDNFEFKGMYSFENSNYTMLGVSATIAEVKNCYFHGWGHGPVYDSGPCDEYYDGIMHSYSNRWVSGSDKDELYSSGFKVISTSTENREFDIRIHHCYIDGSDVYPVPGDMGSTVAGHVTHFYNNYVAYTQNILTPSFCDYIWGNTFEQLSIIPDVDASNHHNLYQSYGGGGRPSYVYNNYSKDISGGASFIWYPTDNTEFYAFNNVDVRDRNQIFQLSSQKLTSATNTAGFYIWNNSVQCVSPHLYSAVSCSPSGYPVSDLFVKNNHLIARNKKINAGVNSSTLDDVSNVFHTVDEAESLSYSVESTYPLFHPSENSSTVGTGTDISSVFTELIDSGPSSPSIACQYDATLGVAVDTINHTVSYPNRTPVKRDSTWDIGAYDYSSSTATQIPTQGPTNAPTPTPKSDNPGPVYYVRAGATGANDGSSWADAWTELPYRLTGKDMRKSSNGVLERGATYYIADGEYPSYIFDAAEDGDAVITIKKATIDDHGTDVGWDNSYGDGQAVLEPIIIHTGYWVIDGSRRDSKNSGHGFKIVIPGDKEGIAENCIKVVGPTISTRVNNITVKYFEFTSAIGEYPHGEQYIVKNGYEHTNGGDNVYIGYCYFHHFIGPMQRTRQMTRLTAEHNYYEDNKNYPDGPHGDAIQLWGANASAESFPSSNCVIRYNEFCDIEGTGYINLAWGLDKIRIYGNVFNYSEENDKMGCWIAYFYKGKVGSVFIYNNTIVNANFVPDNNGFSTFYIAGSAILEGTEQYIYNNLWFNCRKAGVYEFENSGYHYISQSTLNPAYQIEDTVVLTDVDPFADQEGYDYRLSTETPGKVLTSEAWWDPQYDSNKDMNGVVRGEDGVWDIGAYEFAGTD